MRPAPASRSSPHPAPPQVPLPPRRASSAWRPRGSCSEQPEDGELVLSDSGANPFHAAYVYADGRLIWTQERVGWLEERLTLRGVELLRSGSVPVGAVQSQLPASAWEALVSRGTCRPGTRSATRSERPSIARTVDDPESAPGAGRGPASWRRENELSPSRDRVRARAMSSLHDVGGLLAGADPEREDPTAGGWTYGRVRLR
jgi:hypothetical protein